jgi:hypothetical protein
MSDPITYCYVCNKEISSEDYSMWVCMCNKDFCGEKCLIEHQDSNKCIDDGNWIKAKFFKPLKKEQNKMQNKINIERDGSSIFVVVDGKTTTLTIQEARTLRNELNDNIDQCCYEKNKEEIQKSLGVS